MSGDARSWRDLLADAAPWEGDARTHRRGVADHRHPRRGGMGAVYAVERAMGPTCSARGAQAHPYGRIRRPRGAFHARAQTLARLQIRTAALFDGGFTGEGDPYFVMERVDGAAIDQW